MLEKRFKCYVATNVILIRDDNILLRLRKNTEYGNNKYGLISGHLENHETVLGATIREAFEEANIVLKEKDLKLGTVMHRIEEKNFIDFFFVCKAWEHEIINKEPTKCGGLKFFKIGYFPQNTLSFVVEGVNRALNNDIYCEFLEY